MGSSPENKLLAFLQQQLPISISAIKQMISADIKKKDKKWWKELPSFKQTKHIDP